MKLFQVILIYAGGPGSGCNPAAGECGRHTSGVSNKELDQFIQHWRFPVGSIGFGDPSQETRERAKSILRETLPGGKLQHLHPGPVTVYRGYNKHKVSKNGVSSFSRDRGYAKGYGEKLRQLTLTKNTPALDIQKTGRHLGSEVLVWEK